MALRAVGRKPTYGSQSAVAVVFDAAWMELPDLIAILAPMATWRLEPTRETVHGLFCRDFPAVLTVDSGDSVVYRTLDAGWHSERPTDEAQPKFEDFIPEHRGNGHCLVGPIAIRGAEPGMVLEIRVEEIRVGAWGWTYYWYGVEQEESGFLSWSLDADTGIGRNQFGHEIALRPFMGVMGMPPDAEGTHPTGPPRRTGGNLDCKELVAGTSLFLPIEVPGGMFSLGDGHAVQGDGEACGTAIECPIDRVAVTLVLHEDMKLQSPRARIPGAWITFGLNEDLDLAADAAVADMVDLIIERYAIHKPVAHSLVSLAADLRVTQVVNGTKGVHVVLRDDAFVAR